MPSGHLLRDLRQSLYNTTWLAGMRCDTHRGLESAVELACSSLMEKPAMAAGSQDYLASTGYGILGLLIEPSDCFHGKLEHETAFLS